MNLNEGWKQLINARKAHYFIDGRSICNKWMFLGNITNEDFQTTGSVPQRSDCKVCWRGASKRIKLNG